MIVKGGLQSFVGLRVNQDVKRCTGCFTSKHASKHLQSCLGRRVNQDVKRCTGCFTSKHASKHLQSCLGRRVNQDVKRCTGCFTSKHDVISSDFMIFCDFSSYFL